MAFFRWVRARQPSTAGVVALLLGPGVGMLFLNRWRLAVTYVVASLVVAVAPFMAADAFDLQFDVLATFDYSWLIPHLIGVVHCILLARGGTAAPPRWYARWPVLLLVWVPLPMLIAGTVRTVWVQPFDVPATSMEPALHVGDYFFVDKSAYGYSRFSAPFILPLPEGRIFAREPEPGDVVVFRLPSDPTINYIKRVVAGPGDRVQMRDGVLHINGTAVDRSNPEGVALDTGLTVAEGTRWIETLPNGTRYPIYDVRPDALYDDTAEQTVPAGHYFMLGDHRDRSQDSRDTRAVGPIPADHIVGRASVIVWNNERQEFLWHRLGSLAEEG